MCYCCLLDLSRIAFDISVREPAAADTNLANKSNNSKCKKLFQGNNSALKSKSWRLLLLNIIDGAFVISKDRRCGYFLLCIIKSISEFRKNHKCIYTVLQVYMNQKVFKCCMV